MTRSVTKRLAQANIALDDIQDDHVAKKRKVSKKVKASSHNVVKKEQKVKAYRSKCNLYNQMETEVNAIDWDYFPGKGFCLLDHVHAVFATDRVTMHIDGFDKLVQISGKFDEAARQFIRVLGGCESTMLFNGSIKPYVMQVLSIENYVTFVHNLAFVHQHIMGGHQLVSECNYYLGDGLYFRILSTETRKMSARYSDTILGCFLRATDQSELNLHNILCIRVVDFMCIYKRLVHIVGVLPYEMRIPCAFKHSMLQTKNCEVCQPRVCLTNCYGKQFSA